MIHATSRAVPGGRAGSALAVVAVAAGVALAGCAAGQVAQTAYQANSATGATVNAGSIAVRDAQIPFGAGGHGIAVYPVGGSAPVEMHIVNVGAQTDRLLSASSPVASSVQVTGTADLPGNTVMVVGAGIGTGGQTLGGAAEPTAPPSGATAAPTAAPNIPQPTAGAAPPTANASDQPPGGLQPPPTVPGLSPGTRYVSIVLNGLREDIEAGKSYELVLAFEKAGQVRVPLTVGFPTQPRQAAEHE